MHQSVFHRRSLAGLNFKAIVLAAGLYLSCRKGGDVALGVSSLQRFQPTANTAVFERLFGWWVVKSRDEARISLPSFDHTVVPWLADEFGLVIGADGELPPAD